MASPLNIIEDQENARFPERTLILCRWFLTRNGRIHGLFQRNICLWRMNASLSLAYQVEGHPNNTGGSDRPSNIHVKVWFRLILTYLKTLFLSHARGALTREGQGVKRLIKLLKVFLCNFTEILLLIFSLNGDKALARDLLMLLCQTQVRNDNRKINSQRKVAGETIKRGRKPKVSGIIHESEPGLSS